MKSVRTTVLLMMLCVSLPVYGSLIDRGGGMIYDDVFNITWLADGNYAKTSGFDDDGLMTWYQARDWASQLVYGGYDDWRLPSAWNRDGSVPSYGFYQNGS